MNRWRAFAGHLAISATIVAALVAFFAAYLFPMPFFSADGGWRGIVITALLNIAIGPLLTLIVCSRGKSRGKLVFDLTVIGFLQVSALCAGFWTVYASRTESIIFVDGTFYAIDALTAKTFGPPYQKLAYETSDRPFYAVIDLPDDHDARQALRSKSLGSGIPLYTKVELITALGPAATAEISGSVERLGNVLTSPQSREALDRWLSEHKLAGGDIIAVPTWCRREKIVTILDRTTGKPLGHLTGVGIGS